MRVATGQLAAVCKVEGKMVCWNTRGNKLAIVTKNFNDIKGHGASAASGSMGCGASQISPTDSTVSWTKLCDMCSIKFTLMTPKKLCCECSNYFCSACLPREQGSRTRTCSRCRVLQKSPPLRSDLMKLRVKDLQHFLSKRQINIKACVGKLPRSSFD